MYSPGMSNRDSIPARLQSIRRLVFPTRKKEMHVADWCDELEKFRRIWGMDSLRLPGTPNRRAC